MGQNWSEDELVTHFAIAFNEQRAVFCWSSPAANKGSEAKKDIPSSIMYIDVN